MFFEDIILNKQIQDEIDYKKSQKNIELFSTEAENMYKIYDKYLEESKAKLFLESFEEYYSKESAFSENPSLLRNAFLRTSMLFRYNKDVAIMEYLKSLSKLDVNSIKRIPSNTVFGYENIKAFNEIMNLIETLGTFDDKEVRNIIDQVSSEIDSFVTKGYVSLIVSGIPIVGLIGLIMLIMELRTLVNYSAEMNAKYAERLMDIIGDMIAKSSLRQKIGQGFNKSNPMDMISKLSMFLNKQRQIMYPSKIKNSLRPKLLKPKQIISYEDKVKVVELLSDNYMNYINVLSSGPYSKMDAARLILKGADIENTNNFGYYVNSITDTSAMGDLYFNLILTILELTDFVIIMVQDLKRY